jgi:hypothetical protein
MTPQERQLIDDLFARLSKVETAPRDPEAMSAIMQGLRVAPNAIYALVQTVLVQDEALRQAHHRIEELEGASAPQQAQGGSFLDTMRDAVFGSSQSHGSVPNVPPPAANTRPVWNSGQVLQQSQSGARYDQGHYDQGYGQNQGYGNQGGYNQGYGAPQGGPMGGAFGGGGGSFLGTAAAAAAGMVGGSLLLNSFRGMMGGGRSAFGDTASIGNRSPWSDQSRSDLARDAGINDIGSQDRDRQELARQDREQDAQQDRDDDNNNRAGFFDSASNDDDHDSDGFDGDGGGDSDSDDA